MLYILLDVLYIRRSLVQVCKVDYPDRAKCRQSFSQFSLSVTVRLNTRLPPTLSMASRQK